MKKTDRQRVYDKYGGKCAYSGNDLDEDWQIDHLTPIKFYKKKIVKGDPHTIDNLIPCIGILNHYKRAKDLEQWRDYLKKLHIRMAGLPKNSVRRLTNKRKAYLQKVADYFGITSQKPFNGIFYFETLKEQIITQKINAMSKAQKITWSLQEVDKTKIKLNSNNPKMKDAKGMRRLEKLAAKYNIIFDGILNADLSMIDGHSRLELNPNGKGHYFIPSRQLNEKEYKELNALFDLAKAGNPDMLMVEEQIGEELMTEWDLDSKKKDIKPKDVVLVPYKRTHILLSFPPEKMIHIQKYLQKITEHSFVEYEQSSN